MNFKGVERGKAIPDASVDEIRSVLQRRIVPVLEGAERWGLVVGDLLAQDNSGIRYLDQEVSFSDGWKNVTRAGMRDAFMRLVEDLGIDLEKPVAVETGEEDWYKGRERGELHEIRRFSTKHPNIELVSRDKIQNQKVIEQSWYIMSNRPMTILERLDSFLAGKPSYL